MNIPVHFNHFTESLETVFRVKNTYSYLRIRFRNLFEPGSGMEKFGSGIRYKHPGPATLHL
jgi:hypothetical protein